MEKRKRYLGLESALIGDAIRKLESLDHVWGSVRVNAIATTPDGPHEVTGSATCSRCGMHVTLDYGVGWAILEDGNGSCLPKDES